jgi:hypothetical protein
MKLWRSLGVGRVNIIDYTNWPSFWTFHLWKKQYEPSLRACGGDLLKCFVRAAHDHGLELISDLKTFDLGGNWYPVPNDRVSATLDIDNRYSSVIPEIAAHREWTPQAHPDLKRDATFPIRKLRLFSLESIPALKRSDVEILTSRDNKKYAPVHKQYKVTVRQINRPHKRWTPTGAVADSGSTRNWMIEIDGLEIREPFVALRFKRDGVALLQRGYMIAEAFADGDDNAQPFTVATNGNTKEGFFCWRGWQGWTNLTENLLTVRRWPGPEFGLVFRIDDRMPSLLEPAYDGARQIWIDRVKYLLDAGADGVSIRTYCHHAGPMCYLQYAYATPILETFKQQFGRMPENTPRDYQAIREFRRDAYTQFMRDARSVTRDRGKKLMFELESGQELSSEIDCRMQLPIDWERWIREGLVDEVRLKWWTPQTPFVHERVLPVARKHGVPVSVISRCLHTGIGTRTTEMAREVIAGAAAAGFDGYNLYEHQNLMDVNPEGRVVFKGPVDAYVGAAREALAQIASQNSDGSRS